MMTDIFFISKYYKENLICVVIGAAEGGHFIKLAKMFPKVIFHLYDPRKFKVTQTNQIRIYKQFFTNKEAEEYYKIRDNIIVISDIRNMPDTKKPTKKKYKPYKNTIDDDILKFGLEMQNNVDDDMKNQKKWVDIMQPIAAGLKFRLPYFKIKQYEYYDAEIFLQQYGAYSTEGRMFVEDTHKLKIYDCKEYDEKLAYFNMIYRDTRKIYLKYKKQLNEYNLKSIYDTIVSCDILRFYYKQTGQTETIDKAIKLFNDIIEFLQKIYSNESYKRLHIKNIK